MVALMIDPHASTPGSPGIPLGTPDGAFQSFYARTKAYGDNDLADLTLVNGNFGAACEYEDYRYDSMNRLTSFVAGSDNGSSGHTIQEHEYRYDALGRRVISRKDLGETYGKNTRFIYGKARAWQLLEEYEEDFPTDLQTSHVYCGHAMDDVLMYSFDAPGAGGFEDYYIHSDEQLTVMAVSDDTGTIQERYRYTDYGTPTFFDGGGVTVLAADANTDRISSAIGNRHLYTGQVFDEETGLSQYRWRYLHHGLGRFITRDLLGYIDGMNSLAYARTSPNTHVDIFGLSAGPCHTLMPPMDHSPPEQEPLPAPWPPCGIGLGNLRAQCRAWASDFLVRDRLYKSVRRDCQVKMYNDAYSCCMGRCGLGRTPNDENDCVRRAFKKGRICRNVIWVPEMYEYRIPWSSPRGQCIRACQDSGRLACLQSEYCAGCFTNDQFSKETALATLIGCLSGGSAKSPATLAGCLALAGITGYTAECLVACGGCLAATNMWACYAACPEDM